MTDDEAIALRATVIGGWPDDYTVIWRTLPIGRIMLAPGLPPHVPQWRWTCNVCGKPGGGSGSGDDLENCKRQFRAAWAALRAGLTEEDIARVCARHRQQRSGQRLAAFEIRCQANLRPQAIGATRISLVCPMHM
jgi:hypothetical protein